MPFNERILQSMRRWLQQLHHTGDHYLIIERTINSSSPRYLECEMSGFDITACRWTKNPSRATVFDKSQKQRISLPADGRWLAVLDLPITGKPPAKP